MPYFFVLLGFVLAMLTLSATTIACAVVPRLRWAFPFAWRVQIWSATGCILANVPVFALYFVPLALDRSGLMLEPGKARSAFGIVLAVGLLLGPIIASAAGFCAGALFGLWRGSRKYKPHA